MWSSQVLFLAAVGHLPVECRAHAAGLNVSKLTGAFQWHLVWWQLLGCRTALALRWACSFHSVHQHVPLLWLDCRDDRDFEGAAVRQPIIGT